MRWFVAPLMTVSVMSHLRKVYVVFSHSPVYDSVITSGITLLINAILAAGFTWINDLLIARAQRSRYALLATLPSRGP